MIEQFFVNNFRWIRQCVKENIEEWASDPDGPFNTDPLIEPRLKSLSKVAEYSILDSVAENGRLWMFVVFRCDGTIQCKRYENHGDDSPLSTTRFSGGVTFEIDVNLSIDLGSGEVTEFDYNCIAWKKWPNWPIPQKYPLPTEGTL